VVTNSMIYRAALALTAAGTVLVAANWYAKPDAGFAWTAPLAMFAVMFAALQLSRRALRSTGGWTWVLCGLGSAIGWLALSIDAAEIATTVLVVAAMVMTIVQMLRLRLRRPRNPAPGLS